MSAVEGEGAVDAVPAPAPSEAKVDILVVDDSRNNLLAVEAMLADLGQNLVFAQSGRDALRHLLEQDFALALLDVQMPELDGFETARIIRTRERTRHMPIIFLTAYGKSDEQIARGYELGAVDFLFKPLVPEILKAKVQAFVELSRKSEEIKRQAQLLREGEKREHERRLAEAAQRWEAERLREEMARERRNAETLAATVAERERAEVALQRSNQRLRLLADVANLLLLSARPEDVLGGIFERLGAHLGLELFVCYLTDDDGQGFRLGPHNFPETDDIDPAKGDGCPLARHVASGREVVIGEWVQLGDSRPLALARAKGMRACVGLPLLARERLLGTLAFCTRESDTVDPDAVPMLNAVCDQVAMAVERARLIDELSLRNVDLAEMGRRKDEFLAILAHELRNPMAPIVNAVQVLRLPSVTPEAASRSRDAIDRQIHHMVRLVDDLLDVARITSGKISLRRERVSLASVVSDAVQTTAPSVEQRGQRLSLSLPPTEVTLWADPTRIAQVIANLLNNASRYSPAGSNIALTCAVADEVVEVRVRDRGTGIEPEMLDQVFELFVQAGRKVGQSQGGLGLGLSLVKSLVELHGGTVEARSEGLGMGSEFVVRLPLTPGEASDEEAPREPAQSFPPAEPDAGLRVLVIDDNADVREILRDYLELRGHTVEVAEDGQSGIDLALSSRPQVALVDIGLPGLDGYEVAAAIRARAPDLAIRLIALTGFGRPEDRRRAMDAGFDAHLVKPVDPEQVHQLLVAR
ncbi:MAG: response regulator [Polyangiales bacterium]